MQMAADKGELQKESSTLRSKLVAEKQHAAVLQVMLVASYISFWVLQQVLLCTLHPPGCFESQPQTSLAEPVFQIAASVVAMCCTSHIKCYVELFGVCNLSLVQCTQAVRPPLAGL